MAKEQGFPPPGYVRSGKRTEERTIDHGAFSVAEARKESNEILDTLKRDLYASGISPAEIGAKWAAIRMKHDELLAATLEYRNAKNDEERTELENAIRSHLAELKGGDVRDSVDEARQDILVARPKEPGRRRRQAKDPLDGFSTTFSAAMKGESEAFLDSLDTDEASLRARLDELEDAGVDDAAELSEIRTRLKEIDSQRVAATEATAASTGSEQAKPQKQAEAEADSGTTPASDSDSLPKVTAESVLEPHKDLLKEALKKFGDASTTPAERAKLKAEFERLSKSADEQAKTPAPGAAEKAVEPAHDAASIYQSGGDFIQGEIAREAARKAKEADAARQQAMASMHDPAEAARILQSGEGHIVPGAAAQPADPEAAARAYQTGEAVGQSGPATSAERDELLLTNRADGTDRAKEGYVEPEFMKKLRRQGKRPLVFGDAPAQDSEEGTTDGANDAEDAMMLGAGGVLARQAGGKKKRSARAKKTAAKSGAKTKKKSKKGLLVGGVAGVGALGALIAFLGFGSDGAKQTSTELKKGTQKAAAARTVKQASVPSPKLPQGMKVVQGKDGAPATVIIERTAQSGTVTAMPEVPAADSQSETERTEWTKAFNTWMAKNYPQGYDAKQANKVRIEMVRGAEKVRGKLYPIDVASLAPKEIQKRTAKAPPVRVVESNTPSPSATRERQIEVPQAAMRHTAPEVRNGFEVSESETHLYAIRDEDEPGGKALVVYGGGDTGNQAFVDKINAYARQYPNRAIYYNSGTSVYSATFDGNSVTANLTPRGGTMLEMQLDPSTFVEKLG